MNYVFFSKTILTHNTPSSIGFHPEKNVIVIHQKKKLSWSRVLNPWKTLDRDVLSCRRPGNKSHISAIPISISTRTLCYSATKQKQLYELLKKCLITSASNVSVVGQKTSKLQNTVLDLLEDGDDVMKDRGFDINVIWRNSLTFNILLFLDKESQLSSGKEMQTKCIESVRVLIQQAIEKIENCKSLPATYLLSVVNDLNKMWLIYCYLVGFFTP